MQNEDTDHSPIVSLHIFIFTCYLGPGKEWKEFVCGKKIETEQQLLLVFLFSKANFLSCPLTGSNAFNPGWFQKESEMGICLKYFFLLCTLFKRRHSVIYVSKGQNKIILISDSVIDSVTKCYLKMRCSKLHNNTGLKAMEFSFFTGLVVIPKQRLVHEIYPLHSTPCTNIAYPTG